MARDNYVHSGKRGDRTYCLYGITYLIDTICSQCKYDLGAHEGARCLRVGQAYNSVFTPLVARPELELPIGV